VIFLSVQMDTAYYRRAMQLRVADYLEKPVEPDTLYAAVHKAGLEAIREREEISVQRYEIEPEKTGKLVVVFSPKGGVGTTTLAVNLGAGLAKAGHETILVDADLEFGDVGVAMNVRAPNSVLELVEAIGDSMASEEAPGAATELVKWAGRQQAARLQQRPRTIDFDPEVLPRIAVPHASGCHVVIAPPRPELAELVRGEALVNALAALQLHYEYVVVDTASRVSGQTLNILDNASQLLVVTTPSIPSLKNMRVFQTLLESITYPIDRVHLVVNQMGLTDLSIDQIGHYLRWPVACEVAHDPSIESALTRGEVIVGADPARAPAARGLAQLVEFVATTEHPDEEMTAKAQAKAQQPRGTGWLRNPFTNGH
jgi:pilus assembly protein CpaE